MWTCPKCGREFKRTNQDHYCGKAPESVEEYIGLQPEEAQTILSELVQIVRDSVPGVHERIAWSMPRFEKDGRSISCAAFKKHVSLYADVEVFDACKPQLDGYVIKKNVLYLPYGQDLPKDVIEHIVVCCLLG